MSIWVCKKGLYSGPITNLMMIGLIQEGKTYLPTVRCIFSV